MCFCLWFDEIPCVYFSKGLFSRSYDVGHNIQIVKVDGETIHSQFSLGIVV
jgi:hypothetical protein